MVKLIIDNKYVEIESGATILKAAEKAGIMIPTLCYNKELSPAGACRICVVEVIQNGESTLAAACTQPVADNIEVLTASESALAARKLAVEMLLAQKPHSNILQKLADSLGITKAAFEFPQNECILCRLCTRACQEIVGVNAITFVATEHECENSEATVVWNYDRCIACGSCAYICPTQAIYLQDNQGIRILNTPSGKMEFKLKSCSKCGSYFAPEKQIQHMARTSGLPPEKFDLCMDCRE
jgi:NADH dehydrogenase/NADH:ubiquinone oxidoreductase subunit G